MNRERWKPIRGYEKLYEVSDHGRVRSFDRFVEFQQIQNGKICAMSRIQRGRLLKPVELPLGYQQVTLYLADKSRKRDLVHRLVADAFVSGRSELKSKVLHKDDTPSNNHYRNLKWGTSKHNSEDMVNKGRSARGEKQGQSWLTEDEVRHIVSALEGGTSGVYLAQKFGVTQALISAIKRGRVWNHVTGLKNMRVKG